MGKQQPTNGNGSQDKAKNQEHQLKPSQRYSDDDLQEFKLLIEQKIGDLESQLESSKGEDLSELKPWEKENVFQAQTRTENRVTELKLALTRIQNKTYGVCVGTGRLIPKERLRLQPTATKSVEAEKMGSKGGVNPGFNNFISMATEDDNVLIPHEE